jgi:hypothetical protein
MDPNETEEIDIIRKPSFSNLFSKYANKIIVAVIVSAIILYVYFQVNLASGDEKAFTSGFINNIFVIVVPVIGILCLILLTMSKDSYGIIVIAGTIFAMSLFGMVFYFLQTKLSKYIFNKYLLYIVIALIIIFGLSIVSTLLAVTLRRQPGWTGFFSNLLFYIPCLIRDGIQGFMHEYKSSSTTLIVLFFIEILLLLMYFYLVPTFNKNVFPENITLLDDPILLNTSTPLSVAPIYKGDGPHNNFAISMWVYVNPAPNTKYRYTQKTPIFTYANGQNDYFIKFNYFNDVDESTQFNLDISNATITTIKEIASETPMESIPVSMPLQKWNNIVFNVTTSPVVADKSDEIVIEPKSTTIPPIMETTVDVFINGSLVQSALLKSTPTFSNADRITVGNGSIDANVDGLYGAICNVTYYRKPLSKLSLTYNYNTLVIKNPPV